MYTHNKHNYVSLLPRITRFKQEVKSISDVLTFFNCVISCFILLYIWYKVDIKQHDFKYNRSF